ncbi:hypothetical protein GCM10009557_06100 [Virgisporangium ochraceum]
MDHPDGSIVAKLGGSGGPTEIGYGGSGGPASGGPPDPRTDQDRPPKSTDHPDADLRTAVTAPRATQPPKTQIPGKSKCAEHGLDGGLRDDGKPACPLCRVVATRELNTAEPPAADNVVQFRPRQAELRACLGCCAPTDHPDRLCPACRPAQSGAS